MGDSIAKRLVEQNGKRSNGRMTFGSGLLCLVIPTNEELTIAKKYLLSRTVPNNLHTLVPGAILITAADRNDIIIAAALAALSRLPIADVILTGEFFLRLLFTANKLLAIVSCFSAINSYERYIAHLRRRQRQDWLLLFLAGVGTERTWEDIPPPDQYPKDGGRE
jgi:DRTGG domain-containing protein